MLQIQAFQVSLDFSFLGPYIQSIHSLIIMIFFHNVSHNRPLFTKPEMTALIQAFYLDYHSDFDSLVLGGPDVCPEHPIGLVLKAASLLPGNTKKPLCLALETGILLVWGYDIGLEISLDDSNVHPGLRNSVGVQKEGQAYLRSLGALNMRLLSSNSSSCQSLYGWIRSQDSGCKSLPQVGLPWFLQCVHDITLCVCIRKVQAMPLSMLLSVSPPTTCILWAQAPFLSHGSILSTSKKSLAHKTACYIWIKEKVKKKKNLEFFLISLELDLFKCVSFSQIVIKCAVMQVNWIIH